MKNLKFLLKIIILTILTLGAFGGGCIFWSIFCAFVELPEQIVEIGFYISIFLPIPFCWYLVPKIDEEDF